MTAFRDYQTKYENIAITRDSKGIITLQLHTRGDTLQWGASKTGIHEQLGRLFRDVALDRDNRVVVLTGTGESFCEQIVHEETPDSEPEARSAQWSRLMQEGRDLLINFLNIEVPVISAINGPARVHSELPLLADVVLAAKHTEIQDLAHTQMGIVPGDGIHSIWLDLLGTNRGRYFLFTGQALDANELQRLGLVAEVLPAAQLTERAAVIAGELASLPPLTARYTRLALTQRLKRNLLDDLGYGLALEGLSVAALMEG